MSYTSTDFILVTDDNISPLDVAVIYGEIVLFRSNLSTRLRQRLLIKVALLGKACNGAFLDTVKSVSRTSSEEILRGGSTLYNWARTDI